MYPFYPYVDPEAQERLNELQLRNQIELQKEAAREQILNESRLDLTKRKMQLQEYHKAVRSASYTDVSISSGGEITVKTCNKFTDLPERRISNFRFEAILKLISSDGETGIFYLQLSIEGVPAQLYLKADKMGQKEYFMRKITSVGGVLLVDTERERRNILMHLWAEFYKRCQETLVIPTNIGWIRDKKNYRLVKEGEILWKDVIRRAK